MDYFANHFCIYVLNLKKKKKQKWRNFIYNFRELNVTSSNVLFSLTKNPISSYLSLPVSLECKVTSSNVWGNPQKMENVHIEKLETETI